MSAAEMEKKIELMNEAEEAEYDAAEEKVQAAESLLADAEARSVESEIAVAEKAVADAEAEFDILMDRQEPLELELMEEIAMEREDQD